VKTVAPRTRAPARPIETDQPGYYPGYSTLGQNAYWDRTTRETVFKRVEQVPPIRFFTPEQARTMQAIVDRLLPQDDRRPYKRIPILNHIDDRLFRGEIDGYQYEDMPSDRDAVRWGIEAINNAAQHLHAHDFVDLSMHEQDEILKAMHDGKPLIDDPVWHRMMPEPILAVIARSLHRGLLRAPLGVGRSWIRWASVSARVHATGRRQAGALGVR
jgi:hypothetical protein